jgi:hypothetical protein
MAEDISPPAPIPKPTPPAATPSVSAAPVAKPDKDGLIAELSDAHVARREALKEVHQAIADEKAAQKARGDANTKMGVIDKNIDRLSSMIASL